MTGPKNVAVSIRQRLLNVARESGTNFDELLRRFAIERLLYRLGRSDHQGQFILKGATLFTLWGGAPHRATRDLDLLGYGASDLDDLKRIFREVVALPGEEDGLIFHPETVTSGRIREDQEYEGVRVTLIATLASARIPMQIDVGFGDAIHPSPQSATLPTILPLAPPCLRAYPRETVVAEKVEALVKLGEANSRLKDYYDLWFLAKNYPFSGKELATALGNTFKRRRTPIPAGTPIGLTEAFHSLPSKRTQWSAFVRRAGLDDDTPALHAVIDVLAGFVLPPLGALSIERIFDLNWSPSDGWGESK